jgi:hypothetical protein
MMFTSKIQYFASFLLIYKEMKMIIMKNLDSELWIVNGSINYIENIYFHIS